MITVIRGSPFELILLLEKTGNGSSLVDPIRITFYRRDRNSRLVFSISAKL